MNDCPSPDCEVCSKCDGNKYSGQGSSYCADSCTYTCVAGECGAECDDSSDYIASGGVCKWGCDSDCGFASSEDCGASGRGTNSCSDDGVEVNGACYWGESCSASGYTAPQSDANKPATYYESGSTCYYACTVTCTSSGWSRSGCQQDTSKGCAASVCSESGWDDTACGNCASYNNQNSCEGDSSCDWCPSCSNAKYSDGSDRCVASGACSYSCSKGNCGAECDSSHTFEVSNGQCNWGCDSSCSFENTQDCYNNNCDADGVISGSNCLIDESCDSTGYTAPTPIDCDTYDKTSGTTIRESEPTSSTCKSGCSGQGCCEVVEKVCDADSSDGFYVDSSGCGDYFTIEGDKYYCYYGDNGFYVSSSSSAPAEDTDSRCSDGYDNDCNGLSDCDDPDCQGTQACGVHDLSLMSVEFPDSGMVGEAVTFKASVRNTGDFPEDYVLKFFVDDVEVSGCRLDSVAHGFPPLNPNNYIQITSCSFTPSQSGVYELLIRAEPVQGETNLINNMALSNVSVQGVHDVAVANVSVPQGSVRAASAVNFSARISDVGDFDESGVKLNFSVDGRTICLKTASSVVAGQKSAALTCSFTPDAVGSYALRFEVLPVSGETNLDNNVYAGSLNVVECLGVGDCGGGESCISSSCEKKCTADVGAACEGYDFAQCSVGNPGGWDVVSDGDVWCDDSSSGTHCFCRNNSAPSVTLLNPSNNAVVDDISSLSLSWSGGDVDGDSLSFRVFLGEQSSSLGVVSGVISSESFNASTLVSLGKSYEWLVEVSDGFVGVNSSKWSFSVVECLSKDDCAGGEVCSSQNVCVDCDSDQLGCGSSVCGSGSWLVSSVFELGTSARCCGDDANEFYINNSVLNVEACCNSSDACVDSSGLCMHGQTAGETSCGDGLDNDCDGKADCDDPDCQGTQACGVHDVAVVDVSVPQGSVRAASAVNFSARISNVGDFDESGVKLNFSVDGRTICLKTASSVVAGQKSAALTCSFTPDAVGSYALRFEVLPVSGETNLGNNVYAGSLNVVECKINDDCSADKLCQSNACVPISLSLPSSTYAWLGSLTHDFKVETTGNAACSSKGLVCDSVWWNCKNTDPSWAQGWNMFTGGSARCDDSSFSVDLCAIAAKCVECNSDSDCGSSGESCISNSCEKKCTAEAGAACEGFHGAKCYGEGNLGGWTLSDNGSRWCDAQGTGTTCYCGNSQPTVNLLEPANGATEVDPANVELKWYGDDVDGDDLEFLLYLGKDSNTIAFGQWSSATSIVLNNLEPGTTYAWKVKVRDGTDSGAKTSESQVFSFATSVPPEVCDNGVDDDGDNKVDYFDDDCVCPSGSSKLGGACFSCDIPVTSVIMGNNTNFLVRLEAGSASGTCVFEYGDGSTNYGSCASFAVPNIANGYHQVLYSYSSSGTMSPMLRSLEGGSVYCGSVSVVECLDDGDCVAGKVCDASNVCVSRSVPVGTLFVTSGRWSGNLGGRVGANNKCQASASSAGLPGKWVAFLSTSDLSVKQLVLNAGFGESSKFYRMDGLVLADGVSGLFDGSMNYAVHLNENGVANDYSDSKLKYVWTGYGGFPTCSDWTDASRSNVGTHGRVTNTPYGSSWNISWVYASIMDCGSSLRLYCLRVPDSYNPAQNLGGSAVAVPEVDPCSRCGAGLFNVCDRDECLSLGENCAFSVNRKGKKKCFSV